MMNYNELWSLNSFVNVHSSLLLVIFFLFVDIYSSRFHIKCAYWLNIVRIKLFEDFYDATKLMIINGVFMQNYQYIWRYFLDYNFMRICFMWKRRKINFIWCVTLNRGLLDFSSKIHNHTALEGPTLCITICCAEIYPRLW